MMFFKNELYLKTKDYSIEKNKNLLLKKNYFIVDWNWFFLLYKDQKIYRYNSRTWKSNNYNFMKSINKAPASFYINLFIKRGLKKKVKNNIIISFFWFQAYINEIFYNTNNKNFFFLKNFNFFLMFLFNKNNFFFFLKAFKPSKSSKVISKNSKNKEMTLYANALNPLKKKKFFFSIFSKDMFFQEDYFIVNNFFLHFLTSFINFEDTISAFIKIESFKKSLHLFKQN